MTELKCFRRTKGAENELSEQVLQIKVDDIRPNRAQPRAKFDQNSIDTVFCNLLPFVNRILMTVADMSLLQASGDSGLLECLVI